MTNGETVHSYGVSKVQLQSIKKQIKIMVTLHRGMVIFLVMMCSTSRKEGIEKWTASLTPKFLASIRPTETYNIIFQINDNLMGTLLNITVFDFL